MSEPLFVAYALLVTLNVALVALTITVIQMRRRQAVTNECLLRLTTALSDYFEGDQ